MRLRRRKATVVIATSFTILVVAGAYLGLINVTPWPPQTNVKDAVADLFNFQLSEQQSVEYAYLVEINFTLLQ